MNNKIICLVGKSGSGKTSIANKLEERYGLKQIKSYTTRPPRQINEDSHTFVNQDEFNTLRCDLVAYTLFNNFEYGATSKQIDSHELYVVDWNGVKELKEKYKGNKKIITIYIDVHEIELIKRMTARGDSLDKALERALHDLKAFNGVKFYCDYVVTNYFLNDCIEQIWNIWKGN
jgi:guanylate kinase